MVFSSPISSTVRESIAFQIAARMPDAVRLDNRAIKSHSLGESLRFIYFNPDRFDKAEPTFAKLLANQKLWHHQIYDNESGASYARSVADRDDQDAEHAVVEYGISELPNSLKYGFDWIDQHVSEDAQADIIFVPSRLVTAIWIHGDELDHILVVSQSRALSLPTDRLLDAGTFAAEMNAARPIEGLGQRPVNEA
jgi:hypothetical protein